MNCAFHADVPNAAFCVRCGRALCSACTRGVRGSVYCEPCLAEVIESAAATPRPAAAGPQPADGVADNNPTVAFTWGLIPGVGAIYNGEFAKAAIHILIFGLLTTLSDAINGALIGLMIAGFYFYMPFEAYYTAKKRKLRREGIELDSPIDRLHRQLGIEKEGSLYGGIALIIAGAVLLLDNFNFFNLSLGRLWPLLLVGFGIWLVKKRQERAV